MTDFAILKADVADYMARDDLTSAIPTFVRLAESRIRDKVRVRDMETTADLAISSQSTALPAGFLGLRRLIMDSTTYRAMEYIPPDSAWRNRNLMTGGNPEKYTIEGNNLVVFPGPGSAIDAKITYFKAYDALSEDADTNWLLTNAYDVYLYSTMAEAKSYIEDDEQAAKYLNQFNAACDRVNDTARRSRQGAILSRANNAP
jgi:hypothetical protein